MLGEKESYQDKTKFWIDDSHTADPRAPALPSGLRRDGLPGHKLNMLTKTDGSNLICAPEGVFLCSWTSPVLLIQLHLSAPPSLPATSGAFLTPSVCWHLCRYSPLGVWVQSFGMKKKKEWLNEENGVFLSVAWIWAWVWLKKLKRNCWLRYNISKHI